MALNLGSMFAWLSADTSGLDKAERRMGRFVRNTNKQYGSVSNSARAAGRAIAAVVSIETLRRAALLADEYKGINARIKNATKEAGTYLAVQRKIVDLSNRSGGAYLTSANLFQAVNRTLPELGGTQQQALDLTETINKLGVISGASSTQMRDGMLQFSQAMASGIMRAEEWNSIMENIPEVGVRIAKGLNTTVGALRLAVLEGEVLSKDVFYALLKQTEEVNEEFALMPVRLGMGYEALKTGGMAFIGQLDQQYGLTQKIAEGMKSLGIYLAGDFSNHFFKIHDYTSRIADGFATWRDSAEGLRNIYAAMGGDAQTMATSIGYAQSLTGFILDSIAKIGPNIKLLWNMTILWLAELSMKMANLTENAKAGWRIVWEMVRLWGSEAAAFIHEKFSNVIAFLMEGVSKALDGLAGFAGWIGFDKAEKSMKGLATTSKEFAQFAKANAKSQIDLNKKTSEGIKKIIAAQSEANKEYEVKKDLLEEEKDKVSELYDIELTAIERSRLERERAHKEKMTNLEEERRAAEEALAAQVQGEGISPPRDNEKKGRRSGAKSRAESKLEAFIRELEGRFNALQSSLMNERELEEQHYAESLATLNQAEANKIASIIPYHELRERMEKQHQENLMRIEQERLDARLGAWGDFFGNLSTLQESESKKMAAIGRAAAIAQVLIDTARAAMASYAWGAKIGGPILGMTFAAAAGVAGGVQLAAIRSAKATGGEVGMGGAYRVNEQGPEMLSVGGQDILMMGSQGGKITPNSDLGMGSGGDTEIVVNVYTLPGQKATVEQNGDREVTIRMAVDQTKKELASEARDGGGVAVPAILAAGGIRRKAS